MISMKFFILSTLSFFILVGYTKANIVVSFNNSSINSGLEESELIDRIFLNKMDGQSKVDFNFYNKLFFLLSNKEERKLHCMNEISLEIQDLGQVTGLAVDPKTKKVVEAKGVKVILIKDKNNRRGWSIKKSYPIK